MDEKGMKLVIGALLHDIGKVVYRTGDDMRSHSQSGYDFLSDNYELDDDVLDCVRYHHSYALKQSGISGDSIAYIVYISDNIAAATDRRDNDTGEKGFDIHTPLSPVFNILNGNSKEYYYKPDIIDFENDINYPVADRSDMDESVYGRILDNLKSNLKSLNFTYEYVNSLLEALEANLSFVASSTSKGELADISLYDHIKLTAAMASCINVYLESTGETDYKRVLFDEQDSFYSREAFMIASMDISGIQSFIYTISTKNALKTLRSRSFYLELLMEHIIDELLQKLGLSRANLMYRGGGHCYLILPATDESKRIFDEYVEEINAWLLKIFQTQLYIAGAWATCSAKALKNDPDGSYSDIFKRVSAKLSEKKRRRYSAEDIKMLNSARSADYTRECVVCRKTDRLDADNRCRLCSGFEEFSKHVLYAKMFCVVRKTDEEHLIIPGNCSVIPEDEKDLREEMENDSLYVRAYGKNKLYSGKHIATKLWVGDYTTGETFAQLAEASEGINRIGILRADVDNLGQTIVAGFDRKYATISRTATLSGRLSMFFKHDINLLLKDKKATIVYSGGDDVFIAGAWDDVIRIAVELHQALQRYSEGSLTISAGIGIYEPSYPISLIAKETAESEDRSKKLDGKNAVTIFENMTYHWDDFIEGVLQDKLRVIEGFFETQEERGKAFLYKLMELIRGQNERINFARYVYLLARMEPDGNDEEETDLYKRFSEKMVKWIQSERDRKQLETAIMIYVYKIREVENEDNR